MQWYEVKIFTTSAAVEEVSQMLYYLDIQGVSIEDPGDDFYHSGGEWDWDYIDLASALPRDPRAVVTFYLSQIDSEEDLVRSLLEKIETLSARGYEVGTPEITIKPVDSGDWEEEWKKYYHGFEVGERLYVIPSWEALPETSRQVIVLDPGGAFGTGTHETTFNCMLALEDHLKPGQRVYDIGCGSGILAITAAKLGAGEVVGIDYSPTACAVSRENAALNGVADRVVILEGNLTDHLEARADVIVANIIADVISQLSASIGDHLADRGVFIASGIIQGKEEEVREALTKEGYAIVERRPQGEWVTLVCRRGRS
jgi:ribosomal protein L11 methyltransferase